MKRGESHKWYKRTSIKAYLLLQGLRLVVEIKYMAHKPLSTSLLNQASRAHCLNTCTVTVSENCTKARCNISQIHFKLHFPFQDSVQGHQKSEKPKMDSVCLSVTCFAKSLTLSEIEIFLYIFFLECWAYLSKIISDAPVVRKAHATAILLLLLPKFYRCYLYYHMLQFQKLLIQVPHLLSQGSKWQTISGNCITSFDSLYVSFYTSRV